MGLTDYQRLVEEAGERTRETGCVDLVDLTAAVSLGVQADTFIIDVENAVDALLSEENPNG